MRHEEHRHDDHHHATTVMITTMTTTGMTTSAANKAKDPGTTADSGCGPGNIKGFGADHRVVTVPPV